MAGFDDPAFFGGRMSTTGIRSSIRPPRWSSSPGWTFDGHGIRLLPVALRYSWPSELDLMAGQAGLRLRERYAGWDRRPFGSDSASHISVYRPA